MLHSLGGTGLNGVVLANLGALLIGSGLGALLAGARARQAALLALALALFHPLFLYLPSSMQEVLQMGVALALAGAFARLLSGQAHGRLVALALTLFASLLRQPWTLLILPALLLGQPKPRQRADWARLVLLTLAGLALMVLLNWLFLWSTAPYVDARVFLTNPSLETLPTLLTQLTESIGDNLRYIFESAQVAEWLIFVQLGSLLLGVLVWHVTGRWRGLSQGQDILLHAYLIAALLAFVLLIYRVDAWRAYRLIAPHLLFSLALLIWRRRSALALGVAAVALLFLPQIVDTYESLHTERFSDRLTDYISQRQAQLAQVLAYQPDAERWCNTVSASPYFLINGRPVGLLASIPAGMGMSWIVWREDLLPERFRSAYLLLTDDEVQAQAARLNLEPLLEVRGGMLYRNLDSDCAGSG
ncbi:MAG: hypothetical protein NZ750_08010 [Anaerolineae bacterium]|nr:hypothetical protein [Anaerolineae bacterium]MDW8172293.1 hypothetical protein [Anaerolineae bacterium]